jgi:hydrogenase expression/formation protein HypC
MCLSIPGKILSIDGDNAKVDIQGNLVDVNLQLVDDVKTGDHVLVHVGFALEKISDQEAKELLSMLDEIQKPENPKGRAQ